MKNRKSLLVGLGILVTLLVTTPVMAAMDDKQEVMDSSVGRITSGSADELSDSDADRDADNESAADGGTMLQNENSTGSITSDAQIQKEIVTENKAEVAQGVSTVETVEYVWVRETDGQSVNWILQSGSDVDMGPADAGFYVVSGHIYWIGEGGILLSGVCEVKETDSTLNNEAGLTVGKYYFQRKGTTPKEGGDGLGAMCISSWSTETVDGKEYWYWSGADGRIDSEKIGWQNISGKWFYLKVDGERDISRTGDQAINGDRYYLKNDGTPMTGFQKVGGQTYYYAKDGKRQGYIGWKEIDGNLYYFNNFNQVVNSGASGWVQTNGKWYWFENGSAASGWRYINNKWYYMDPITKVMKTGLYTVDGIGYYSDASGAMCTGWIQHNGTWFYFHENGAMAKGWLLLGNTWYYLDPATGVMQTGMYSVGGTNYYSDASGAMRTDWILINGKSWYYFNGNGAMAKGWLLLGNTWYYLDPATGVMKTGMYNVGGATYYSNGNGAMATGWVWHNNNWYYFNGNGAMVRGWVLLGKTWYYLDPSDGVMKTGLYDVGGEAYYSDASGAMRTGWIKLYGTNWYYFTGSGAMAKNTWIDGYWVDEEGIWIPGYRSPAIEAATVDGGVWIVSGSSWNYLDKFGNKVTGWKYIGGYKYYFDGNGNLIQDVESIIGSQSSYKIVLNRVKCQLMIYAKDETGRFCIPVKSMVCSVGLPGTPTPTGNFKIEAKTGTVASSGLVTLMGPSWGKWGSMVTVYNDIGIFFHSVACSSPNATYTLPASQYNLLGYPASHGCIRLCVRDAKWIWMNCSVGTAVEISDTAYCPFDKPVSIKIPESQNWDPTDPDVNR